MSYTKNGKFVCTLFAAWDDSVKNLDRFRCYLTYFSLQLYEINLGFISIALLAVIVTISIFGRIKENYRWFILNQAIWDILSSYYFTCENYAFIWTEWSAVPNCLDQYIPSEFLNFYIADVLRVAPYAGLLLLTFSRFACLYFPVRYGKLTKGHRLLYFLIIYNFLIMLLCFSSAVSLSAENRKKYLIQECKKSKKLAECKISAFLDDFFFNFLRILSTVLSMASTLIPFIFVLLSIIFSSMIILKVSKQFKFQWRQNRESFVKSLRIASVIFCQVVLMSFVLISEFAGTIELLLMSLNYQLYSEKPKKCPEQNCIVIAFPEWLHGYYGLDDASNSQAILQIRIFIESFIVLIFMTGYREAIFNVAKVSYGYVKSSREFSTSKVTTISAVMSYKR